MEAVPEVAAEVEQQPEKSSVLPPINSSKNSEGAPVPWERQGLIQVSARVGDANVQNLKRMAVLAADETSSAGTPC